MSPARRILVVDDDREMVRTLADVLRIHGWTVTTAHSGEEAVRTIEERSIPLVLMDIKMSGITGVEALKRIRAVRPRTRVVLMTAYSASELVEEAAAQGALDVLAKPVALPHLLELVDAAVAAPRPILVVDDDPDFLRALCEGLEEHGVPTRSATSLPEALDILDGEEFRVVLLDLRLDGIPGEDSVATIKEACPEILVVLFSGYPEALRRVEAGAPPGWIVASLTKPFDPARLMAILETVHAA